MAVSLQDTSSNTELIPLTADFQPSRNDRILSNACSSVNAFVRSAFFRRHDGTRLFTSTSCANGEKPAKCSVCERICDQILTTSKILIIQERFLWQISRLHNDDALVVETGRICDYMVAETLKCVNYTDGGERSMPPRAVQPVPIKP